MVFSGSIFLLIIYSILPIRKIKNNGEEVIGNIIDYDFNNDGDATPVIEFKTRSDEKINGTPFLWSNFSLSGMRVKKSAAKKVKVIYDMTNPSKFILPSILLLILSL